MALVHLIALLLGVVSSSVLMVRAEPGSSEAISCLTNAPAGDSTVSPRIYTHGEGYDVCIKYQTLSSNQWLWAYGATSSAKCAQMIQQSQQFKNVHCCMQPNCNAPDAVLNPNTRIVRPAKLTAAFDHSRSRPQLAAKQRRKLTYSSSKQSLLAKSKSGSITCYRNVPTRFLQAGQQSAVAWKTYMKTDMSELCARYSYKCVPGDGACSKDDIQTGVWKWMYAPLPESMCLELKDYSESAEALVKNVKCCSDSLCNRPDSALDMTVAVLTPAQMVVASINGGSIQHKQAPAQPASSGRSSMLTPPASLPRASHQQSLAVDKYDMRSGNVV